MVHSIGLGKAARDVPILYRIEDREALCFLNARERCKGFTYSLKDERRDVLWPV